MYLLPAPEILVFIDKARTSKYAILPRPIGKGFRVILAHFVLVIITKTYGIVAIS